MTQKKEKEKFFGKIKCLWQKMKRKKQETSFNTKLFSKKKFPHL